MTAKKKGFDQSLVRDLANILNDTDLTEIEVEQEDMRIRVSRSVQTVQVQAAPIAAPAPAAIATPSGALSADASASSSPAVSGFQVPSPMVGTCYLAPAPDASDFIQVGDTVEEGQTLLIIEAMKTMNQIPSPKAGKIVEITVSDGQPVEFGDTLVVIA